MKHFRRRRVLCAAAVVLGSLGFWGCHRSSAVREGERAAVGPTPAVAGIGQEMNKGWTFGPVTAVPATPPGATVPSSPPAATPLPEEPVARLPRPPVETTLEPPSRSSPVPPPTASPAPPSPADATADATPGDAAAPPGGDATVSLQDVFFDFDDATIREDQRAALDSAAAWLKGHPAARLTIEGYSDERGTSEYNMALAYRRALAAKAYLVAIGIAEDRIRALSWGEERPFVLGHDETVWRWNRRAHFVVNPSG